MAAMRRVVSASARAFVSPRSGGSGPGGGNPVSIFLPSEPTSPDERTKLAQSCPWESVVIENETKSSYGSPPTFHFFMPSGEEVSFCGHAAIGACSFLANKDSFSFSSHEKDLKSYLTLSSEAIVPFLTAADGTRYGAKVTGNEAELLMDTQHYETKCNSTSVSLEDVLSELGLDANDLLEMSEDGISLPSFINSSVARPKTLIPIKTAERMHAATPPQNPIKFCELCDSIDSTGIYLYSQGQMEDADGHERNLTFQCRQFPRSSGYPEDPATGIAAGALAASLHQRKIMSNNKQNGHIVYDVFQGTSMGRPSKIKVKIGDCPSEDATSSMKISYTGLVVFDSFSHSDLE